MFLLVDSGCLRAFFCVCFCLQGDSFAFPITQDIKGAAGPQGPDGENVSHTFIVFLTSSVLVKHHESLLTFRREHF